ncbi:hypothetical protein E3N88_10197 [Mikania micrantha]|uniref:Uncharacterized protein n=1 Tax=Mikania micrantha TaxID=192012 RepID=A0A5N6PCT6_9ASTR|nr:hypothetical protein E3N88_10197 [Mikania micrantha]
MGAILTNSLPLSCDGHGWEAQLSASIMAGRRGGRRNAGGRGNISLTPAELNALINERVEEALATREATRNQNPLNQGDESYFIFTLHCNHSFPFQRVYPILNQILFSAYLWSKP